MIDERCITTTTATTIGLDDNNQFYLWHIKAHHISWVPYIKKCVTIQVTLTSIAIYLTYIHSI